MNIHVKIVEGTLYKCDAEESQFVLSEQEWGNLDLRERFDTKEGRLVTHREKVALEQAEQPKKPIPPFALEMMYEQGRAGERVRLDALWDAIAKQDTSKMEEIAARRKEIEAEHERQLKEYEESK